MAVVVQQRAIRGTKKGWRTRGARFSPEEDALLVAIAAEAGLSIDTIVHDAVLTLLRVPKPKAEVSAR